MMRLWTFATMLSASLLIAGMGASAAVAQPLGIGTSPQGTVTYQMGAALAKALTESAKLQARVQPNSGTGSMIPLVNSGEIDVGFCNALELIESFAGTGSFDKRPNPKLRQIATLYPLVTGLFVRADSPIQSVKDLKGKKITYGFTSQEVIKTTVDAMLATHGLSIADMQPVLVPNLIRGIEEFMAGRVDVATFALGGAKTQEADASVGGIRWLDLGDSTEANAALGKVFKSSYIGKAEPAASIAGLKGPIHTMHYDYTLFVNADVPAERVKAITAVVAEQQAALAAAFPGFREMKREKLYKDLGVPFHDGAIAYYKEKGIALTK
jgi:uncharacterized protein